MKGNVDLKYYGHSGFKLSFLDTENVQRNIYIDISIQNKLCPEEEKKECPNDADLVLISRGSNDHSQGAPALMAVGKKEERKLVLTSEAGSFMELLKKLPPAIMAKMQPGGTKDFEYCKVSMVRADCSSTCLGPQGVMMPGGMGAGFVIEVPNHNFKLYHASSTNVFSDMKIIDDLHKPDVVILPIGGHMTMGPREAAYAVKNFLPTPKTVIPMNYGVYEGQYGTVEEFEKQLKEFGVEGKEMVNPEKFFGGAPIVE